MTFHPRFTKAHKEHRTRNEREVKTEAKWATAPFFLGQTLQVVSRTPNTIVVSYFDGRAMSATCRLEPVVDDQDEYSPDAIDILTEDEGEE